MPVVSVKVPAMVDYFNHPDANWAQWRQRFAHIYVLASQRGQTSPDCDLERLHDGDHFQLFEVRRPPA